MFDKLTIFYNKRTGDIKEYCTGVQDMNWFGDEKQDYEIIFDYIVIDYDGYLMNNPHMFKIENGKVKLKENTNLSKYI